MKSINDIFTICSRKIDLSSENINDYRERLDLEIEHLKLWDKHKSDKAKEILDYYNKGLKSSNRSNSLIIYLMGISDVDPIANEKKIVLTNVTQGDPPDIDTDFDPRVRDWLKKDIVRMFGANKVCSIGTYTTYKTRAVLLDVARVLGENLSEVSKVSKGIDPLRSFEDSAGEEHTVDQMSFDDLCEHYPSLKKYFEDHPDVERFASVLRNQVRNMGKHAGGVIISDLDLTDRIPVLYDKPSSEDRMVISAWAESGSSQELSSVGLVKYDILGLSNLPIIADCVSLIEETTGEIIGRDKIPQSDRESILLGSKKDLVGIFQFENPVTKPIADAVGMESLNDVAAITSLIRPGPMDADINGVRMPFEYARRKKGGEYICPQFIRDALPATYGLIVYQEQIMLIAKVLSGFTPSEANQLRKAAGKKSIDLMHSIRERFINGAKPRIDSGEITLEEVKEIWTNIEYFAGYGFNKSHAVAYGAITTAELWLKYNYPLHYLTSLINNTKQGKKKLGSSNLMVDYVNYARRCRYDVLPPCVNSSKSSFTIEDGNIRYSLRHIKNVANSAPFIEHYQPYLSMEDFYERVKMGIVKKEVDEDEDEDENEDENEDIGSGVLEVEKKKKPILRRPTCRVVNSLIAAGAFNCFGTKNEVTTEYYKLRKAKKLPDDKTDEEWLIAEAEALGLSLSKPILYDKYSSEIKKGGWHLIHEVVGNLKKRIVVFGEIVNIRQHISRVGNSMHIVTLSDGVNSMDFFVFQGGWETFKYNYKDVGTIGAIPMSRFDESDSDTRFFDDRGKFEIIQ